MNCSLIRFEIEASNGRKDIIMKIKNTSLSTKIALLLLLMVGSKALAAEICPDLSGTYMAEIGHCDNLSALVPAPADKAGLKDNSISFYNLYGQGTALPLTFKQDGCKTLVVVRPVGPYEQSKIFRIDLSNAKIFNNTIQKSYQESNRGSAIQTFWSLDQLTNGDIQFDSIFQMNSPSVNKKNSASCLLKKRTPTQ